MPGHLLFIFFKSILNFFTSQINSIACSLSLTAHFYFLSLCPNKVWQRRKNKNAWLRQAMKLISGEGGTCNPLLYML